MARPTPRHRQTPPRPATSAQPRPSPSRRLIVLAYAGMALLVLVLCVLMRVGVSDTWVQLATGKYIWRHGIPHSDPFTFIHTGEPFVEHEWGACLLYYLVSTLAGGWGLLLLRVAVVSSTLALAVTMARRQGATLGIVTLLFPWLVVIVFWRVSDRPHLFNSLALIGLYAVLVQVNRGLLYPRWRWGLPVLFVLWAQLHAGWIVGLAALIFHA